MDQTHILREIVGFFGIVTSLAYLGTLYAMRRLRKKTVELDRQIEAEIKRRDPQQRSSGMMTAARMR